MVLELRRQAGLCLPGIAREAAGAGQSTFNTVEEDAISATGVEFRSFERRAAVGGSRHQKPRSATEGG